MTYKFDIINMNVAKMICGIIGYPLDHSLSPIMHNAAFEFLGLDFEYHKFEIVESEISLFLKEFKARGYVGLNVTMPHKSLVIPYLDKLIDPADKIGAVNTIVNISGELIGYNTDSPGAIDALKTNQVDIDNLVGDILLIGAGGVARSIGFGLAKFNKKIIVANRTFENGKKLAQKLGEVTEANAIEFNTLEDVIADVVMIINCTPLGLKENLEMNLIPEKFIKSNMIIFDTVYIPLETDLLKTAKLKGAKIIHGYDMLVHQGAAAFKLWTGRDAPIEQMRKVVLDNLV